MTLAGNTLKNIFSDYGIDMRYLIFCGIIIGIIIEVKLFLTILPYVRNKGIGNLFMYNEL